jgi:hypothetical protein
MRINGFVYVVLGTFVAIVSKIIGSAKLIIFLFVGILIALFGIFRLVADALHGRAKAPVMRSGQPSHHPGHNHIVARHHRITRDNSISFHYCPRCGCQMRQGDIFCSRCGARIA